MNFWGFPYPTRMVVVKLSDDNAWIWSPISISDELTKEVEEKVGPVRHIVSPNKIHHIFLKEWQEKYPDAVVYAPPGLKERKVARDVEFKKDLSDEPDVAYKDDFDQVIFRGSFFMEEVVFFHRKSSTAIFCDLIQRHLESEMTGWKGSLMRLDALVGKDGSTPREWRWSFLKRAKAREARDKVIAWAPEKLIIAHGENAESGATEIISRALSWI